MAETGGDDERLAAYLNHRPRLVRLAYCHLGSVGEAEDVAQDAWLRFQAAAAPADPGRYLSRIASNGTRVAPCDITGHLWLDIDTEDDLREAERLLREHARDFA